MIRTTESSFIQGGEVTLRLRESLLYGSGFVLVTAPFWGLCVYDCTIGEPPFGQLILVLATIAPVCGFLIGWLFARMPSLIHAVDDSVSVGLVCLSLVLVAILTSVYLFYRPTRKPRPIAELTHDVWRTSKNPETPQTDYIFHPDGTLLALHRNLPDFKWTDHVHGYVAYKVEEPTTWHLGAWSLEGNVLSIYENGRKLELQRRPSGRYAGMRRLTDRDHYTYKPSTTDPMWIFPTGGVCLMFQQPPADGQIITRHQKVFVYHQHSRRFRGLKSTREVDLNSDTVSKEPFNVYPNFPDIEPSRTFEASFILAPFGIFATYAVLVVLRARRIMK